MRVVLAVWVFLGLGAVPLRSLVSAPSHGLVLGARLGLGTVLGVLEIQQKLLRVGAAAAGGLVSARHWPYFWRAACQRDIRFRAGA